MINNLKTAEPGKNIIKGFETKRLEAYQDNKIGKVWTIGWGHTKDVYPGMTTTNEMAELYLAEDLAIAERIVNLYVKIKLNQNQFDSLVSFTFNLGGGCFSKSGLLKKINAGAPDREIRAAFMKYVNDNGVELPGLIVRRKMEADLYLKGLSLQELESQLVKVPSELKGGYRVKTEKPKLI